MILVTTFTAVLLIAIAVIAVLVRALDKREAEIGALKSERTDYLYANHRLKLEKADLIDALKAATGPSSPVSVVLDVASKLGHGIARFL